MTRAMRTIVLGCSLILAAALVGGCSSADDEGSSSAEHPSGPPADMGVVAQQPRQLSPPVENPRDIRAYGDRPCGVLTTEQLTAFGFDRPPDSTNTLASGHQECVWTDSGYNGQLV